MRTKRAVILTGKAGNGHLSVAEAYQYWLPKWGFTAEVYDVLPKPSDQVLQLLYKVPATYRSLYRLSDKPTLSQAMIEILAPEIDWKIHQLIPNYDAADLVISTNLFVHPVGGQFRIMAILDPTVHSVYFSHPQPDCYFNFWESSLAEMKKNGFRTKKIIHTGPLARPSFYENGEKYEQAKLQQELKAANNIPQDHLIALAMAGSAWIFRSAPYLDYLKKTFLDEKITFVFLCGRNRKFIREVGSRYRRVKNFKFLSWLDQSEVTKWMIAADCGLAFSLAQMSVEAGLTKLPVFIFRLIEGQEEGYRQVINGHGAGLYLPGLPADQIELFKNLLPHRDKLFKKNLEIWQKELLAGPEKTHQALEQVLISLKERE